MGSTPRNSLVYGLLAGAWLLVVAWQGEEHFRVVNAAQGELRNRSGEIAGTLSAVMRAMRFRGAVLQERLEPVLNELVNAGTNALTGPGGLIAIELLNTAGEPVVATGRTNVLAGEIPPEGEHWSAGSVTFVDPMEGASVGPDTNRTMVVLPSIHDMTNGMPPGEHPFPPHEPGDHPEGTNAAMPPPPGTNDAAGSEPPPPPPDGEGRSRGGSRRPPWLRWMSESDYKALVARRELHALVLVMSTENLRAVATRDLWLRCVIIFFSGISALGTGLAWRNTTRNSDLQIRLVRASELNTHLKEMNLAAAGLAHETRNPLNIIRGVAQILSRQTGAPPEILEKSRIIVEETDKVTSQLTEFINYSHPREVRRVKVALPDAVAEVLRTLGSDIEEKKLRVGTGGESFAIEADEQMLRQVLFNLLINAIQAVDKGGQIQILARRTGATEAVLEVVDDGPGVPPERREEIFKPYFTTHQKGTGLGLAIVRQMVLAHGWEIECLGREPRGALFRISHLKQAI